MQKPEIWADQKKASELGSQIRDIKDNLGFLEKWQGVIDDTETALEIADEELINEVAEQLNAMEKALEKFEVKQMLSGEYDEADAILTINAGGRNRCTRLGKFDVENVHQMGRKSRVESRTFR